MDKEEFRLLAKGMRAVYTQPTFLPDADAMNIWFTLLQDLPYMVAQAAVQKHMISNKFPPTIAEIRQQAASVAHGETPAWSDGWNQVLQAIRKYGRNNAGQAMASFDEITKATVERLGFVELCNSETIGVERANFRMIFNQIAERKQQQLQVPFTLAKVIEGIQQESRKGIETDESKRISVANQQT